MSTAGEQATPQAHPHVGEKGAIATFFDTLIGTIMIVLLAGEKGVRLIYPLTSTDLSKKERKKGQVHLPDETKKGGAKKGVRFIYPLTWADLSA